MFYLLIPISSNNGQYLRHTKSSMYATTSYVVIINLITIYYKYDMLL